MIFPTFDFLLFAIPMLIVFWALAGRPVARTVVLLGGSYFLYMAGPETDPPSAPFDTYTAMGGGGSLREWSRRSPPLAAKDLKHLNHRGREKLGGWIYDALIAGYVAHRAKRAEGG